MVHLYIVPNNKKIEKKEVEVWLCDWGCPYNQGINCNYAGFPNVPFKTPTSSCRVPKSLAEAYQEEWQERRP